MVRTWMVSQKLLRRTGSMGPIDGSRTVGTLSANTNPTTANMEPAKAKNRVLKIHSKISAKTVIPKVTHIRDSYILETGGRPAIRHRKINPYRLMPMPISKRKSPHLKTFLESSVFLE